MPGVRVLTALILFVTVAAGCAAQRGEVAPSDLDPEAGSARLPRIIATGHGVVLAETADGFVPMTVLSTGTSVMLRDGQDVEVGEERSGIGGGDAVFAVRTADGEGEVANPRIVTEDRLSRSPDGRFAVFSALSACGDFCYSEVWVLRRNGDRKLLTANAGPDAVVSYRPDGREVAIGSRALYVVSLPKLEVRKRSDLTSPTYGPDGTLYARGADTDDGLYAIGLDGETRTIAKWPGAPPAPEPEADVPDPRPAALEDHGRVLRVVFERDKPSVMRITPDGRIVDR